MEFDIHPVLAMAIILLLSLPTFYSIFYFNSTFFLRKELKKVDLLLIKRMKIDINEKNPFTQRRNNDIRKMKYDFEATRTFALFYYDKICSLDKNSQENISWIKVSFFFWGGAKITFFEQTNHKFS